MPTPAHNCCGCPVSRRGFLFSGTAAPALVKAVAAPPPATAEPKQPLHVQPVLVYDIPKRRPQTSWRQWGGILSEADVAQEKERIGRELDQLRRGAEFPVEIAPLRAAATPAEAAACAEADTDLRLIYAAGGRVQTLEALAKPDKWNLMFLRHRSGPAYLWYEIAHPRFLRKTVDEYGQPGFTNDDVVVDKLDEVAWRLRALQGLRRTQNRRILALVAARVGAQAERGPRSWRSRSFRSGSKTSPTLTSAN